MLEQGLLLMVTGMTVVFIFLSLIVLIVNLLAKFFEKFSNYFPEISEQISNTSPQNDLEVVAAIAAAYLKK